MAGDASTGIDNESVASQGGSENKPSSQTPQAEQTLGGATTKKLKFIGITMPPQSEVSDLDPLGKYAAARMESSAIDLEKFSPELAAKLRQEKKKWFEGVQADIADGASIDFQKAIERLNLEMEARLEISKYLTDQRPDVSMMERWLGKPVNPTQGEASEPVSTPDTSSNTPTAPATEPTGNK